MDAVILGNKLRQARRATGLSQGVAALRIGRSASLVSMLESGDRTVSALELHQLALLYGVSVGSFFDEGEALSVEKASNDGLQNALRRISEMVDDALRDPLSFR